MVGRCAAESLGADLANVGTRFVASTQAATSEDYKAMLLAADVNDLVYTHQLSGVSCNFLKPSLDRRGVVPERLPPKSPVSSGLVNAQAKLWRDIWTAGHRVGGINSVKPMAEIVEDMASGYRLARALPSSAAPCA